MVRMFHLFQEFLHLLLLFTGHINQYTTTRWLSIYNYRGYRCKSDRGYHRKILLAVHEYKHPVSRLERILYASHEFKRDTTRRILNRDLTKLRIMDTSYDLIGNRGPAGQVIHDANIRQDAGFNQITGGDIANRDYSGRLLRIQRLLQLFHGAAPASGIQHSMRDFQLRFQMIG